MKQVILVVLALACFVIGVHQSITVDLKSSYWLFMLSVGLLLYLQYTRQTNKSQDNTLQNQANANEAAADKPKTARKTARRRRY